VISIVIVRILAQNLIGNAKIPKIGTGEITPRMHMWTLVEWLFRAKNIDRISSHCNLFPPEVYVVGSGFPIASHLCPRLQEQIMTCTRIIISNETRRSIE
jgi:hypothetical protein